MGVSWRWRWVELQEPLKDLAFYSLLGVSEVYGSPEIRVELDALAFYSLLGVSELANEIVTQVGIDDYPTPFYSLLGVSMTPYWCGTGRMVL